MADAVERFIMEAVQAGHKYGIPPEVLLGLIEVESSGNPHSTSSAGAQGLTQFIPSTAKQYGVHPGATPGAIHSQIQGAARYLKDLGFKKDPHHALSAYNGIGGGHSGYSEKVMAAAAKHKQGKLSKLSQDAGGTIQGAITPDVPNPLKGLEAIGQFFNTLGSKNFWQNAGKILIGTIIGVIGLLIFAHESGVSNPVKGAARAAT